MIRLALLASTLLSVLSSTDARAAEGLSWRWSPDAPRRYYLRADIQLPYFLPFNAARNIDGDISQFTLTVLVDCALRARIGKNASEVRCEIDKTSLQVAPMNTMAGRLQPVIDERVADFDAAWVDLALTDGGRVRALDLEGVAKDNDRTNNIALVMREMLGRAFATFDLQLPKNGTDAGLGQWAQVDSMAFAVPGIGNGTLGGTSLTHTLLADQGGLVTWALDGRGTVATPEGVYQSLRNTFQTTLAGSAVFDTTQGLLVQAMYQSEGKPTAASAAAENGRGLSYVQTVILQYVAPGTTDPALSPSREVAPR